MFRRSNKITSLLVAAAAVVSLVPASAADVKKINSEDGTIYNAVAYADGKAFVDGEINDDEAAYYVDGGDFTELEDVDSGDDAVLFGEKYLDIEAGDYTVDLDAGTVTDDDIVGDTADDAASALRKEIKDDTDDRYYESDAKSIKDEDELDIIPGAKYASPWYSTTYTAASGSATNGSATSFNIYTDTDGNYIDADYNLGKVKVTTTASGASTKTETIENTDDKYDAAGTSDALRASVVQNKILTQDSDYIYRLATVTVTTTGSAARISKINGQDITASSAKIFAITNDGQTVSFKAIQKISKQQSSSDIDGAYYAKTVTTYALSDDDGSLLSNESLILDANTQFTAAGGKLIAYNTIDDKETVTVNAYSLKSSSGYNYLDEEDESKEDCEFNNDKDVAAVQTDVDGNLWRLDGGYIYKFDNTDDWDKIYKVDGSLDELSVYDEDNIIAWNEDDEVYSIISSSSSTESEETPVETPAVTTGWVQAADGTWSYINENGTKATGWLQNGSNWFYLNANGTMTTGWQNIGGTWYYLNPISDGTRGAMKTGWQNVGGTWYYLNPISDGTKGAMKTGWINDNGTWYYCNTSGAMLANTTVNGYVLGSNGAWIR